MYFTSTYYTVYRLLFLQSFTALKHYVKNTMHYTINDLIKSISLHASHNSIYTCAQQQQCTELPQSLYCAISARVLSRIFNLGVKTGHEACT